MADYLPRFDSLWSTTTWITAFSNLTAFAGAPPVSADDVFADGKTITIDTNINVASLRTTTAPRTGGSAGGGFRATNNTSLTANLLAGTTTCLTFASAAPNFFTLVGNITASSTGNGINNSSTGIVTIVGNLENPSSSTIGIINNGTANVIGITRGRRASGIPSTAGIINAGTVFVTGTVFNRITNNSTLNFVGSSFGGCCAASNVGIYNASTGTLNMTGTSLGQPDGTVDNTVDGIQNEGIINMIGNAIGSPIGFTCRGIGNLASGVIRLTGFAIGGLGLEGHGIGNTGTLSTVTLVGTAFPTGGNRAHGIYNNSSSGAVTVSGFVYGLIGTVPGDPCFGFRNDNTAVINITNAIGRTNGNAVRNLGSGVVNVNYAQGGVGGVGVDNSGSGTVYIRRAAGAPGGLTNPTGGTFSGLSNSQNGLAFVQEFEYGAQGVSPVTGPVFINQQVNSVTVMRSEPLLYNEITLFTSLSAQGLFPPASSVRVGTVYGNGDFTGTMIVPTFSAVQVGVPVDDTVGIFLLSPDVFWQFNRQEILNYPDSIGYRIANLATIPSVGQLIGSFNLSPPMSTFNILQ